MSPRTVDPKITNVNTINETKLIETAFPQSKSDEFRSSIKRKEIFTSIVYNNNLKM